MALTKREKEKLAKLRASQRSSLVFRKGKKLDDAELSQRRAGIQRNIDDLTSRRGGARDSRGSRRSTVPSVTDTNINQLIASNVGQPSGNQTTVPSVPSVASSVASGISPNFGDSDSRVQSIFSQFVPGAGTFKQGRLEREMGFSPSLMDTLRANTGGFVPEAVPPYVQGGSGGTQVMTPSRSDDPSIKRLYAPTMRNASSIPSIFSQPMVGDAVTVANNIDEVIPTRDRTGTFADGLDFVYKPRFPFDIPFTYARENPRFITDASGMKVRNPLIGRGSNRFTQENIDLYSPFVTERPMGFSTGLMDSLALNTGGFPTMGGVPSAAPTIANPIRVGSGTVGDFRNQLFSNQALNTGLFTTPIFDRTQFNVPVGAFAVGSAPPINFEGKTYNQRLQEGLDAAKAGFPNINAFIDTTLPLSTFNFGTNLTSSPTATEFDIFGNPRNLGADEIISRYGDTINQALQGKSYTII